MCIRDSLIAVAINENAARGAEDGRATVAVIELHAAAATPFPGDELVVVFEIGDEGVVELPVILELIASAGGGDALRIVDAESPAADVDFVGAVVQRLAGSPCAEPCLLYTST